MFDIKVYAKAVAAFVAGVIANMATDLVNGTAPWPQTGAEWSRYLITSFGAAIGAYAIRNKITPEQAVKSGVAVTTAVVPVIAQQATDAAQDAIVQATKDIPLAGPVVKDISDQVGSVVDRVIRDFQNRPRP